MYAEDILHTVLQRHPCCGAWAVPFSLLGERAQTYFNAFAPACTTAVVLGHHVTTMAEWTWYAHGEEEYCAADDHAREVCEELVRVFTQQGFQSAIVPYPDKSGLRFRDVAQAAEAGEIGINAFLLHPEWGPWIHLRVLATDTPVRENPVPLSRFCTGCDAAGPARAIRQDSFDGLICRSYRDAGGEYTPGGPDRAFKYCTICADVCPIGPKPM